MQLWWFLPYIDMNQPGVYMCSASRNPSHLSPHPILLGCPSALALSALFHASNLDWRSHMVIYMFQCYSLKPYHPHLLSQSPKFCSLYLCLFCCLAYRVIIKFSSVQLLSMSDSLCPHKSQHARPLCPSPSPGDHSDSRPSSQ